jgi:hypothetical protein
MNVAAILRTTAIVTAALILVACTAAGGSPSDPGNGDPGSPGPSAVAPQDQDPAGSHDPILVDPVPGGSGELTIPQPGQLDARPVPAESLEAGVDGQRVTIKISWTSGIEPCYVLDSIRVDEGDMAFAIMVIEGHAPGDNVCIEIAKFTFALIGLGELAPGAYTISDAAGGAAPIEVVVG